MTQKIAMRLFEHWGIKPPERDFAHRELGELLHIAIGLCALFDDDKIEHKWMTSVVPALSARPIDFVLAGQTAAVLEVVNQMRGLR